MKTRKASEFSFLKFILFNISCSHSNSSHFLNTDKTAILTDRTRSCSVEKVTKKLYFDSWWFKKFFSPLKCWAWHLRTIQSPIQWISEAFLPEGKVAGAWSWPLISIYC